VTPVVVHVVRPYDSEQEYLNAEAWTIDARSMLLIDAEPLPADTPVLFDISLGDGAKPIRAEGRVTGTVAPNDGRPGGLRVRFKRFGAATKAFIERAVRLKSGGVELASQPGAERPSLIEVERPSQPGAERPSLVEAERSSVLDARPSMTALEAVRPTPPQEASGTQHRRVPGPVAAPQNRDELLARLRQRRQTG
jgi:hypothetical protein